MLDLRGHRAYADRTFRWSAASAAALVLLILGLIAITITRRSVPVFREMGLGFFTTTRWSPADALFGALPFVWGTAFTAVIALVIAVPISLGMALFMTQVAPPAIKKPMVYLMDLLAGRAVGGVRPVGRAGAVAALRPRTLVSHRRHHPGDHDHPDHHVAVPRGDRDHAAGDKEGALALGATRWEMIGAAVLPHSAGGLVGAVMLGLGRAMGETIAAALVIGSALGQITLNPFAPGNSMPAVIANEWGEADDLHKSALIALAVTLFVITIVVNLIATAIVQRSMKRSGGKERDRRRGRATLRPERQAAAGARRRTRS